MGQIRSSDPDLERATLEATKAFLSAERSKYLTPSPPPEMQGPKEPGYNWFRRNALDVLRPIGEFLGKHPTVGPAMRGLAYPGEHVRGKIAKGSWAETATPDEVRQQWESRLGIEPPQSQQAEDVRNIFTGVVTDPLSFALGARLPKKANKPPGDLPPVLPTTTVPPGPPTVPKGAPAVTPPPQRVAPTPPPVATPQASRLEGLFEAPPPEPLTPPPPAKQPSLFDSPETALPIDQAMIADVDRILAEHDSPLGLHGPSPPRIPIVGVPETQGLAPDVTGGGGIPGENFKLGVQDALTGMPGGDAALTAEARRMLNKANPPPPAGPALPGELFPGKDVLSKGPIIGHDVNPVTAETDAPLFSRAAQEDAPTQTAMLEPPVYSDELTNQAHLALEDLDAMGSGSDRGGFKTFREGEIGGEPEVGGVPSLRPDWYRELTGKLPKDFKGTRIDEAQIRDVLGKIAAGEPITNRQQQVVDLITDSISKDKKINQRLLPVEQAATQIEKEAAISLEDFRELLGDEEGFYAGVPIGPGQVSNLPKTLGKAAEKFLTVRRMAELHPDLAPYRDAVFGGIDRQHFLNNTAKLEIGKPIYDLAKDTPALELFSQAIQTRRRTGQLNLNALPPNVVDAVTAQDNLFVWWRQQINAERAIDGLPPIPVDQYYTPFVRTGDYLAIARDPATKQPLQVFAFETPKQALDVVKAKGTPQTPWEFKKGSGLRDEEPTVDFATLHLLNRMGLLKQNGLELAMQKLELPQGMAEHFKQAMLTAGQDPNALRAIDRYNEGASAYVARLKWAREADKALYPLQQANPDLHSWARRHLDYLQSKPNEYGGLRSFIATFDLGGNIGSMLINGTQLGSVGYPEMGRVFGKDGVKAMTKMILTSKLPKGSTVTTTELADMLKYAGLQGHLDPKNATEIFGRGFASNPNRFQWGGEKAAYWQQEAARPGASLGARMLGGLGKPLLPSADLLARGPQMLEQRYPKTMGAIQGIPKAAMWGYGKVEAANRRKVMASAYTTARDQGKSLADAYALAKQMNDNINFRYGRENRAEAFRGAGAPLGIFATFPTEYMSTMSKWGRTAPLAAAAGAGIYWGLAGVRGGLGMEELDEKGAFGAKPGFLSRNLPETLWWGPASELTGMDISSKAKLRVPLSTLLDPFNPLTKKEEVDAHQIPVLGPLAQLKDAKDALNSGLPDAGMKALERITPGGARNKIQAFTWGDDVGTMFGGPIGPDAEGNQAFFHPTIADRVKKFLDTTPLKKAKMHSRERIRKALEERDREEAIVNRRKAAGELARGHTGLKDSAYNQLSARTQKAMRDAYFAGTDHSPEAIIQRYNLKQADKRPEYDDEAVKIPKKAFR